jgi:serine/threonine-protein kinase
MTASESVLGRYRLQRIIGKGAFGEVWECEDEVLRRRVAVKRVLVTADDPKAEERQVHEARVIAQLKHPSIVALYDFIREGDSYYAILELVPGGSVADLMQEYRAKGQLVPLETGLRIGAEVAEALDYAHGRHVLHLDVKPGNLLLDQTGKVKVSDFGLAQVVHNLNAPTHTIGGTSLYMAPEQFEGRNLGAQTDIYQLGATLYHLLTGTPPYSRDSMTELALRKVQEAPPDARAVRPDVPPAIADLLRTMMAQKTADRPGSMAEIAVTLRAALAEVAPAPAAPQIAPAPPTAETAPNRLDVTQISGVNPPTGFFESQTFPRTQFFSDEKARYKKIQETLQFYRDHLSKEYESLWRQANLTFRLWVGCVAFGIVVLTASVVAMLAGYVTEGAVSATSTVLVFFIQRVFQQREDHYRKLAATKNAHLEYGNQWLLVIQSIDSVSDQKEKAKRQAKLVDVLTKKLIVTNRPEP